MIDDYRLLIVDEQVTGTPVNNQKSPIQKSSIQRQPSCLDAGNSAFLLF
jgi:hypothetical protein